jgi:hypothetical protein
VAGRPPLLLAVVVSVEVVPDNVHLAVGIAAGQAFHEIDCAGAIAFGHDLAQYLTALHVEGSPATTRLALRLARTLQDC